MSFVVFLCYCACMCYPQGQIIVEAERCWATPSFQNCITKYLKLLLICFFICISTFSNNNKFKELERKFLLSCLYHPWLYCIHLCTARLWCMCYIVSIYNSHHDMFGSSRIATIMIIFRITMGFKQRTYYS